MSPLQQGRPIASRRGGAAVQGTGYRKRGRGISRRDARKDEAQGVRDDGAGSGIGPRPGQDFWIEVTTRDGKCVSGLGKSFDRESSGKDVVSSDIDR